MVLVMATSLAAMPRTARADGDPASDVLLTLNLFNPYDPPISPPLLKVLDATITRAHASGFPIKVAIIEGPTDLGAIPQLFGQPAAYAKFLDTEISYNSVAKLLVVMPQGFGTFAAGPTRLLAGIHIDPARKSDGLAVAATRAVVLLTRHAGHALAMPALPGDGQSHGSGFPVAITVALAAAVLAGGAVLALVRRRRPGARTAVL